MLEQTGAATQAPAEGDAAVQSAIASQGQATPPPDPLAALTARLDKVEAMSKDLHAERTAHGRTKAMLKVAVGENPDRFVQAFTSYEREKASLLEQGYSQRVIDALAESNPEALLELAGNAPRPGEGKPSGDADEIKALRAELDALKAGKGAAPTGRVSPNGGTTLPQKGIADLADGAWDPKAASEEARRLGVRL